MNFFFLKSSMNNTYCSETCIYSVRDFAHLSVCAFVANPSPKENV